MVCIQEVRYKNKGTQTFKGGKGYKFFWSGDNTARERREDLCQEGYVGKLGEEM